MHHWLWVGSPVDSALFDPPSVLESEQEEKFYSVHDGTWLNFQIVVGHLADFFFLLESRVWLFCVYQWGRQSLQKDFPVEKLIHFLHFPLN